MRAEPAALAAQGPRAAAAAVGVYRGFDAGVQHSMRSHGAFLARCARAAFPESRVIEQFDQPMLAHPSDPSVGETLAFKLDRYLAPRRRFAGRPLDLLAISDHSDAYVALTQRARRCFVTCHDVLPRLLELGLVEGPRPSATGRLLIRANGKAMERADRIVCVSRSTRDDLLAHFDIDPARVDVIHNPDLLEVDVESEKFATVSSHIQPTLSGLSPYVLSVGGGKFYKNLKVAPDVLDSLVGRLGVEVNWVVIGQRDAPPGRQDARMRFISGLSAREVGEVYRSAAAFFFPSLYEGFGLPVIEAQRFGLPVVCSDRGSLPEVAGAGALIVAPDDIHGAADALARVLTDEVERTRLIAAGHRNRQRFSRDSRLSLYAAALRRAAYD